MQAVRAKEGPKAAMPLRAASHLPTCGKDRWPVQMIGVDHCPTQPPAEPTCLLVWRDRQDQVRFMQLAPFAYQLALRLQAGEPSVQAQLELATAHGLAADRAYFDNARALLDDWQARDIWFPHSED